MPAYRVEAFLKALSELDEPLPPDIKNRLNEIGSTFRVDIYATVAALDQLAIGYPTLAPLYQQACERLLEEAGDRNIGEAPPPLPIEPNRELINTAVDTFTSPDPVKSAKQYTKPNILKRIW